MQIFIEKYTGLDAKIDDSQTFVGVLVLYTFT